MDPRSPHPTRMQLLIPGLALMALALGLVITGVVMGVL